MCRVWDIPAHGGGDGGGPPPPPPPPWVRFQNFFFFFLNFFKCFEMFSNKTKMFSFSKLKGGQNGFKRGGKNVSKNSGLGKMFFSLNFWVGFVFFCLGAGVFFDMHVFNPRLPSDCWILGRVRLWMNQCAGFS